MACWYSYVFKFQSTLPRGERHFNGYCFSNQRRFQSTLPRGERRGMACWYSYVFKFQSTLPRGERPSFSTASSMSPYISIHAPARGATNQNRHRLQMDLYFNPRSREGSDKSVTIIPYKALIFQSTLPRGERPQIHTNN